MLAYEISIDGKRVALAGAADWSTLDLMLMAVRGEPGTFAPIGYIELWTCGMTLPDENGGRYQMRWPNQTLAPGALIEIRIVETDSPDLSLKRYRADADIQESPLTDEEERALRYQSYLELRAEFETQ